MMPNIKDIRFCLFATIQLILAFMMKFDDILNSDDYLRGLNKGNVYFPFKRLKMW